ncbi:hypothetical protein EYD10_01788 [Varanus komodoensis]|nr:hypothetical protein EYD10_01788 [Varanus komodoensis]
MLAVVAARSHLFSGHPYMSFLDTCNGGLSFNAGRLQSEMSLRRPPWGRILSAVWLLNNGVAAVFPFPHREPLTLHMADLEDHDATLPFTSSVTRSIFSSTPRFTSSKKLSPKERHKDRSPVHSLLTASPDDLKATPASSLEHRSSLKKSSSPEATPSATCTTNQAGEADESTCRKIQNKMENLQNLVETLQLGNQAMSTMIRCQGKKIERAKEKEKKLSQ